MLTNLRIRNFKSLEDVEIELGQVAVFIGPNNSGKTTALQALALWGIGLRKWLEKRSAKATPDKRPGVTVNRRDLIAIPVPDSNLLWRDLHVRSVERKEGSQQTRNIRIEITVSGVTGDEAWECGFEFDYANPESLYCRPLRIPGRESSDERMLVPKFASDFGIAFLPPMSGLAATEDLLQPGAINVRIGEGRTAEVLRNLCLQISERKDSPEWPKLVKEIQTLFGVTLQAPISILERGQISMSYMERNTELDLVSAGRGLQQTLLLLAHLYANPNTILLLDEPDAHLEILRQRQIYQLLTSIASSQNCQIIAASHSEIILNEAADRDIVIAFVGKKPHRINNRGSQVLKALNAIGFDQYYQAEQTGWVLYLEGSTDLAILQAFAEALNHPAREVLARPFVHYVGNGPKGAEAHFYGLQEGKRDLVGLALFDRMERELPDEGLLRLIQWRQKEIENYLCFRETLMAFAQQVVDDFGPLFEQELKLRRTSAMSESIQEIEGALRSLDRPDAFGRDIKASDDFLTPLFNKYYEKLGIKNLMQKTDFHVLAKFVPVELIDAEVIDKLDALVEVAGMARVA